MKTIKTGEFIGIIQDIISTSQSSGRRFCFILGAGASRNSNIPTGIELAEKWFNEIESRVSFTNFNSWLEENKIDKANLGSMYSQIYLKRFENDKQSAFDFLYEAMRDANPSIGYAILAQILANTKSNVVITTNFDSLVEQSLYYYTSKKPLVCGHENLSMYAKPYSDRPLIIKIHRDLFYNPFSEPSQINIIADSWKKPLRKVFDQYIPIVLGYAGNDGSLMSYLSKAELPDKFFWCYRRGNIPENNILDLLSSHSDSYLVEVPGFDEIMYELMQAFKLDLFEEITKKRFELDVNKLTLQYTEISQRLGHEKTVENAVEVVDYMLKNNRDPVNLYTYIMIFVSEKVNKPELIDKTLEKFPNHPLLLSLKAQELQALNKRSEAEKAFEQALQYGSDYPLVLNQYANYQYRSKKNLEFAEKYYSKSITLMPSEYTFLLDYANFLNANNRDPALCEILYKNAIKFSPDSYSAYLYYSIFLLRIIKDADRGIEYLEKAMEHEHILPEHKLVASFMFVFFQRNIDLAVKLAGSLTNEEKLQIADEESFLFLRDYSALETNLLAKLKKEPHDNLILLKTAHFYLTAKKDMAMANEFYQRLPNKIDDKVIEERANIRAILLCEIDKNYEEAVRILSLKGADISNKIWLGIIYKNYFSDFDKADACFKEYLEAKAEKWPFFDEFVIYADLADLYFYFDKIAEAEVFLDKAFSLTVFQDDILVLWFYRFVYLEKYRTEALAKVSYMLECGVRHPNWVLKFNVQKLKKNNHPDFPLIKKLSERITQYTENPVWYGNL